MMRSRLRCAAASLTALLTFVPAGSGQAETRPLTAAEELAVDRELARYQKGTEPERDAVIAKLMDDGDRVRAYLASRSRDDLLQAEVPDILRTLDHLEGRDLLTKKMDVPPSEWSAWTFRAGEVVVLQGEGFYTGLQVDPKVDPKNGVITVHLAETTDPLLPLGGPGVKARSERLEGAVVPGNPNQVKAYADRLYTFETQGAEISIRSVGTEAFRYRHRPGSPRIARAAAASFAKVKGGDPKLAFRERPRPEYGNVARRVQQYLFRILPGVDPLPTYETPDEATYAFAEHVQVEIREDAAGEPVLLVAFPHDAEIAFTERTLRWLERFAARAGGITPGQIVVWVGSEGAHEANRFWQKKEFVRPKGALLKQVRDLFPEDY